MANKWMRGFHLALLILLVITFITNHSTATSSTRNTTGGSCGGLMHAWLVADDELCSGFLESEVGATNKLDIGKSAIAGKPVVDCGRGSGANYRSCLGVSHAIKIGENCYKNGNLYPPRNRNC